MKPIIFLDIDGVLNRNGLDYHARTGTTRHRRGAYRPPGDPRWTIRPELVDRLNAIVQTTGAEVVITSSWRLERSLSWIRSELRAAGFVGLVVSCTSRLTGERRGAEIRAWLDEHAPVPRFVILDDGRRADFDGMPPRDRARVVSVSGRDGLSDADAARAVAILSLAELEARP